jgi:hypothetical protein
MNYMITLRLDKFYGMFSNLKDISQETLHILDNIENSTLITKLKGPIEDSKFVLLAKLFELICFRELSLKFVSEW